MRRDGDPAPQPSPERDDQARITLRSCREGLRAAVQPLSQDDPALPADAQEQERNRDRNAAIVRDVQAAEEAYDALVTNINHDVKTSLTVIRGHAQMMARAIRRGDTIDRDALFATLKVIDSFAQRISNDLDGWIDAPGADPE